MRDVDRVASKPRHPHLMKKELTDTGCILHLQVPENLYYLEGHFRQVPIVAGVCQLKWVIDYIEAHTGAKLYIAAMEAVKFSRPLFPGQAFVMALRYEQQATTWHYHVFADATQFASGRLIVQP